MLRRTRHHGRVDDPLRITPSVAIPLREIEIRTSRSSGPGGQHANVTDSRVEVIFHVAASAALTEAQQQRIIGKLGPRVTATSQDARSQLRNRDVALERLRERLAAALHVPRARRKTKPSRGAKERRLDSKRQQSERKRGRQRPDTEN